jgi:hypothetical protein
LRPTCHVPPRSHPPDRSSTVGPETVRNRPDARPDEPDPVEEVNRQPQQMVEGAAAGYPRTTADSQTAIPEKGALSLVRFQLTLPSSQKVLDDRSPPLLGLLGRSQLKDFLQCLPGVQHDGLASYQIEIPLL